MKKRDDYNAYMRDYMLRRYHRRRGDALIRLGGACAVCGSTKSLEIDHVDPDQKSFNVAKLWSVSETRFDSEIDKCQLLCQTHHLEKTSRESKQRRPVTHGKLWAATKLKCDCEECRAFLRQYNAERRAKRARVRGVMGT